MKISTEIWSTARHTGVGERKAIELIGQAGFDAWDLSMFEMARFDWQNHCFMESNHPLASKDYLSFVRELKNIAEAYGMECNQSHAPFPIENMPIDTLKRAIECTAEAGGKICIVHPNNNWGAEKNAEFYNKLLPFAKEHNVKIAAENMWNWEAGAKQSCFAACSTAKSFKEHLEAINDDYFVACLDIGHAEMRGSGDGAPYMIRELGDKLQALHIHDNDLLGDTHQIPFSMNIDFDAVAKALVDIDYKGYLTLEADQFLNKYNGEELLDGVKELAKSARRLDDLITKYRG